MLLLVALLLWCGATHAEAWIFTDDSGVSTSFDAPPQRVISLSPNLTELAYTAGLGSRMVAVSAYSDYPPEAKKLPQVGDAFRLDWERIVALKPDLVLAWASGLSARDRAMFEKLKLKILVLEQRNLEDIPKSLRALGRLSNSESVAENAALEFEQQRDDILRIYSDRSMVRIYFQIAATPQLTINGKHIISDVLRLCGAHNVFASAPLLVPAISDEALVQAQPQIMLGMATTFEEEEKIRLSWRKLPIIAVQQGRMGFVHPDLVSRATSRILLGARLICEQVDAVRR